MSEILKTSEELEAEEVSPISEDEEVDTTEEKEPVKASDYKAIVDLIKEMENQVETLKEFSVDYVKSTYSLSTEIFLGIMPFGPDAFDSMDENIMRALLDKFGSKENTEKIIKEVKDAEDTDEEHPCTDADAIRKILKDVKSSQLLVLGAEKEAEDLKKESGEILSQYMDYMSSPKVTEARQNRLNSYKEMAEKENDERKKEKIIDMIRTMDSAYSISFVFARFEKYGEKEIKNLKEAFFDENKGSYVMDRFSTKITKYGYSDKLYKYFFNIEEHFLGEEYYSFNNLFLFNYMRFVAYSDPYSTSDKMYVQSLTASLSNLIYHRFVSTEAEKGFLEVIKRFDDRFRDDVEYWTLWNTTNPVHPTRIEATKIYNKQRKDALIKKMDDLKIEGYDPEDTPDNLQKFMNDKLDTMIKEQMVEQEKNNSSKLSKDEDGSTVIEPSMETTVNEEESVDDKPETKEDTKIVNMEDLRMQVVDKEVAENMVSNVEKKVKIESGSKGLVPFLVNENNEKVCSIEEVVSNNVLLEVFNDKGGRQYVFIDGEKAYFPE